MATEKTAAPAARTTGAAESKDNEAQTTRTMPITNSGETGTAEGLNTQAGREANVAKEDERLEKLNEGNAEGHQKNLDKIEKDAEAAHSASEKGPTSGKEWNRNTPTIDSQGNKHWY